MKINRTALQLTRDQLREIQMVELELMIEVDRICRENDIKYSISYGTLLGAVRHKGFIPWDDDADLVMLREEYNKFCEVVKSKLDTSRFFWQTWDTDPNYRIGYGKLRRLNTSYVRVGQERMKYVGGICIDIFPFDNISDYKAEKAKFLKKCLVYRKIMYSKAGSMCEKSFFKRLGFKFLSLLNAEKIKHEFQEYAQQYNSIDTVNAICAFSNGDTCYYKSMFEELTEIEFEGRMFYAPENYVLFLRTCYGYYYMTPPPENERYGHAPVSEYKAIVPDFLNKQ